MTDHGSLGANSGTGELSPAAGGHAAGVEAVERLLESLLDDYERSLGTVLGATEGRPASSTARDAVDLREIAARLRAATESGLRADADRLRARTELLLESSESAMVVLDSRGLVVAANRAATLLGDQIGSSVTPGSPWAVLDGVGRLRSGVVTRETPDGNRRVLLLCRSVPRHPSSEEEVVQVLDITSTDGGRAGSRESLEKVARILQSLSILCHDINNPLTALAGRAQLLKARVGEQPYLHKAATVIHESACRVADLVRTLGGKVKEARTEAVEGLKREAPTADRRIHDS